MTQAFTFRMDTGFAGAITRKDGTLIETQTILQNQQPYSYGLPVVVDLASGNVRGVLAGDSPQNVYGFAVRPYPTQAALLTAQIGQSAPLNNGILDVMKYGYISVQVNGPGIARKNSPVFVRINNAQPGQPIGGVEAQADGNNTIQLVGDTYFTGNKSPSGMCEIHFMALLSAQSGGGGGGVSIAVDGITVPPSNSIVNFQDNNAAQFNKVLFSNPSGNIVVAQVDAATPAIFSELTITNLSGSQSISFDYPDNATDSYDLIFPGSQGGAGTFLRNDGSGNLSWAPGGSGTGTVTQVSTNITAFNFTNPTSTPQLVIAGSPLASNYLRADGTWQPTLVSAQVSGSPAINTSLTFIAGTNIALNQSGNNITIASTGGGGGGTVTNFLLSADLQTSFTVTNSTITPTLGIAGTIDTTRFLRNDGAWAVPAGGGSGTVTNFLLSPALQTAFTVSTSTTTPTLGVAGTIDTTRFLRNDGAWAVPAGGGGGISSIGITVPTPLNVSPATLTANGTFAFTWTTGQIPPANLGTGIPSNTNFLRGDSSWQPAVSSIQASGQAVLVNGVILAGGANVTLTTSGNTITINSTGGGGGGDFSSIVAVWTTANSDTKNAYSNQPTINSDGITIRLTAASNPGVLANANISLNSVALTNSYVIGGTFPNYTIIVPVADLSGNSIETAATVTVSILIGTQYSLNANNLINRQPSAFNTVLSGNYTISSIPFYTTVGNVNYQYGSTVGAITAFNGTITIGGVVNNANAVSGSFTNVAISGGTIAGNAVGTGLNGAGSSTVNLSGTVAAPTIFTPAFYAGALTGATPPTFTTASSQTPGSQVGSVITYSVATASTQYVWLATTRPITSVRQITTFGPGVITADITASQTISGTLFNVFGFTTLSTNTAVQLTIIN